MAKASRLRSTSSTKSTCQSLSSVSHLSPANHIGHLLTSSNYDDSVKKVTGGRNGYGAKLTNIFSKSFIVETADSKRKKYYKQEFKHNLSQICEPKISAYSEDAEDYT